MNNERDVIKALKKSLKNEDKRKNKVVDEVYGVSTSLVHVYGSKPPILLIPPR